MHRPILLLNLILLISPSVAVPSALEKKLAFPPPIQWKAAGTEISLVGLAWGMASSPEMMSKGRPSYGRETAAFLPDRPYAIALGFRAKAPGRAALETHSCSGLVRIKNVDGDRENPWVLTPSGFILMPTVACGAFDIEFKNNNPSDYWVFFPARPIQKEFLFEVYPSGGQGQSINPALSFTILVKDNEFEIINASPADQSECRLFTRVFGGSVGPSSKVTLQITRKETSLSGTHHDATGGDVLGLKGHVDSLGNFTLEERDPQERPTGLFRGRFSDDCRIMTGYFSKPDGTRLQPFEFHETANPPIARPE